MHSGPGTSQPPQVTSEVVARSGRHHDSNIETSRRAETGVRHDTKLSALVPVAGRGAGHRHPAWPV